MGRGTETEPRAAAQDGASTGTHKREHERDDTGGQGPTPPAEDGTGTRKLLEELNRALGDARRTGPTSTGWSGAVELPDDEYVALAQGAQAAVETPGRSSRRPEAKSW